MSIRSKIVSAAKSQISPPPVDPSKYWIASGVSWPYPVHWCGAFVLWAIKQGGIAQGVTWKVGSGFASALPQTKSPKPGDISYRDQPFQHHGLVESFDGINVTTIDGNQPGVKRHSRPVPPDMVFYSIEPYLAGHLDLGLGLNLKTAILASAAGALAYGAWERKKKRR